MTHETDKYWSQEQLEQHVRQFGITLSPGETISQGVKLIPWPQRKPTEQDIAIARRLETTPPPAL